MSSRSPIVPNSPAGESTPRLAWRVPVDLPPAHRLGDLKRLLAGVVAAIAIWLTAPSPYRYLGLAGVGVIALWNYLAARKVEEPEENITLDDAGLHWKAGENSGILSRGEVLYFRIGLEAETVRCVPALTLLLKNGRESQPVELHQPATAKSVRRFLKGWNIEEQTQSGPEFAGKLRRTLLHFLLREPGPEAEQLLHALRRPSLQEDGRWFWATLPGSVRVYWSPFICRFSAESPAASLADGSWQELFFFLEAEFQFDWEESGGTPHGARMEMERAAFWKEFIALPDPAARCWTFAGTRHGLQRLCHQMQRLPAELDVPPDGVKPEVRNLGTSTMPVEVCLATAAVVSEDRIALPVEEWRKTADYVGNELQDSRKTLVEVSLQPGRGWQCRWHVVADQAWSPRHAARELVYDT